MSPCPAGWTAWGLVLADRVSFSFSSAELERSAKKAVEAPSRAHSTHGSQDVPCAGMDLRSGRRSERTRSLKDSGRLLFAAAGVALPPEPLSVGSVMEISPNLYERTDVRRGVVTAAPLRVFRDP